MSSVTAEGEGFTMTIAAPPASWFTATQVVPALRSPHELFAFSNRPIQSVGVLSDQNHPMIQQLDAGAMLLWGYYEFLGDPETEISGQDPPPIPDYSRYTLPFTLAESEVFPAQSAYDWSPAMFIWRRLGVNLNPSAARPEPGALTLMIWEGTQSSPQDVNVVTALVETLAVQ